ncbi:hypothetical protein [Aureimonas sp. SK2]|uniref:hypothetical protein n=1 Tax=Aureimonas sp. SK2 TaxID=3015992 RepID=UPI0024446229|nr:hypothetical protein [Aureimonas sp. SK2]
MSATSAAPDFDPIPAILPIIVTACSHVRDARRESGEFRNFANLSHAPSAKSWKRIESQSGMRTLNAR